MDEIVTLVLEKETSTRAVYLENSGPGIFPGFLYLDRDNLRKMYGGRVPKIIHILVEGNGQ